MGFYHYFLRAVQLALAPKRTLLAITSPVRYRQHDVVADGSVRFELTPPSVALKRGSQAIRAANF